MFFMDRQLKKNSWVCLRVFIFNKNPRKSLVYIVLILTCKWLPLIDFSSTIHVNGMKKYSDFGWKWISKITLKIKAKSDKFNKSSEVYSSFLIAA